MEESPSLAESQRAILLTRSMAAAIRMRSFVLRQDVAGWRGGPDVFE
jgi:hypothetical protein